MCIPPKSGEEPEIIFSPFKPKSLNYNDNNLEFRFRSLSFIDESQNYFRYKLEGYEETWSEPFISKDHLVRFTNLPPGTYRFHLQTRNALGQWSKIVSTSKITVNEPYWMKWWFYLLIVSGFFTLILAVSIIYAQKRYSKSLEKVVEQRTKELQESEKQYRLTIDSLNDMLYVIDKDYRINLCNKRAKTLCEELNLNCELQRKSLFDAVPFLEREKIMRQVDEVFQSGKIIESDEVIISAKRTLYVNVKKFPIFEGEAVSEVLIVIHDMSEEKKAEEEKRRAQVLLKTAIEQMPAAILVMNAEDEKISLANSAALNILGVKSTEEIDLYTGLESERWQIVDENGKKVTREMHPLLRALKNNEIIENLILTLEKSDEERRWMYVNAAPVFDDKQNPIASVMVFQDITEVKKAEEQIKESLREKSVLLQEIHHRVKNNLQVVSSLLFLQSKQTEDEKARNLLKESQDRIKSIALVHEKMYQNENFTRVNFAEYVRNLTHSLYQVHHLEPGRVDFQLRLDDVAISMETAIPCGLILNELISNSLKYAFPKSFDKARKIEIKIKQKEQNSIELSVADNGIGLPKDFDLQKAESLGLKLVKSLAENQLEGQLKLIRRNGTKFVITFKNNMQV